MMQYIVNTWKKRNKNETFAMLWRNNMSKKKLKSKMYKCFNLRIWIGQMVKLFQMTISIWEFECCTSFFIKFFKCWEMCAHAVCVLGSFTTFYFFQSKKRKKIACNLVCSYVMLLSTDFLSLLLLLSLINASLNVLFLCIACLCMHSKNFFFFRKTDDAYVPFLIQ